MNAPPIPPIALLGTLILLTAGAYGYALIRSRLEQRRLAALARAWRLHYSPRDVFHLADRVAPYLPQPGAATVRVRDCIYGNEAGGHRYFFRVEYTIGATRSKHRQWRVASVLEPRSREDLAMWASLQLADEILGMEEQFKALKATADSKS